jgi:hypothetical protein
MFKFLLLVSAAVVDAICRDKSTTENCVQKKNSGKCSIKKWMKRCKKTCEICLPNRGCETIRNACRTTIKDQDIVLWRVEFDVCNSTTFTCTWNINTYPAEKGSCFTSEVGSETSDDSDDLPEVLYEVAIDPVEFNELPPCEFETPSKKKHVEIVEEVMINHMFDGTNVGLLNEYTAAQDNCPEIYRKKC